METEDRPTTDDVRHSTKSNEEIAVKIQSKHSTRSTICRATMLAAVSVVPFAMGCGGDVETLNRIRQVAQNGAGAGPSVLSEGAADQQQNPRFTRTNFVAPYPDRQDAFVYPGMESESASPDRAVTSVADVQVLGFAKTDQIRVMLRSRLTTQPVAVGGKFEGIEVVSITPPTVELKIGSLIWNATMFDKSR